MSRCASLVARAAVSVCCVSVPPVGLLPRADRRIRCVCACQWRRSSTGRAGVAIAGVRLAGSGPTGNAGAVSGDGCGVRDACERRGAGGAPEFCRGRAWPVGHRSASDDGSTDGGACWCGCVGVAAGVGAVGVPVLGVLASGVCIGVAAHGGRGREVPGLFRADGGGRGPLPVLLPFVRGVAGGPGGGSRASPAVGPGEGGGRRPRFELTFFGWAPAR